MQRQQNKPSLSALKRWTNKLTILTGLLLVCYLCVMLVTQYNAQVNINRTARQSIVGQTEKLVTLLGYYFEECRKDVNALARSRPVEVYFNNKALGMSLQYGMLSSLNAMENAVNSILERRRLNGHKIFDRIVITDDKGRAVYDTRNRSLFPIAPYEIPGHLHIAASEAQMLVEDKEWKFFSPIPVVE
jgi:hypothetical protein